MITQDNLNAKSKRPKWIPQGTPWMDLVVERYLIKASDRLSHYESIMDAARTAERILYADVTGALQRDLKIPATSFCSYDTFRRNNRDGLSIASWRGKDWIIPPYLYEDGIDWVPFDGMQKFHVNIPSTGNTGIVEVNAFVWDDASKTNFWRLGCLADIVNRNRQSIISAEGGRLQIPLDNNLREYIQRANLEQRGADWVVSGFVFPSNGPGYIDHRPVKLLPIDFKQRAKIRRPGDR